MFRTMTMIAVFTLGTFRCGPEPGPEPLDGTSGSGTGEADTMEESVTSDTGDSSTSVTGDDPASATSGGTQ